ncbi:MAG: hypothetical protein IMZ57_10155 [Acidobacteria bacterium]|nr:hypothetical protein [Acidobacteriota bacterium]
MDERVRRDSRKTPSQLKAMSVAEVLLLAVRQSDTIKVAPPGDRWRMRDIRLAVAMFRDVLKEWREANEIDYIPEAYLSEAQMMEIFRCTTVKDFELDLDKLKELELVWDWSRGEDGTYYLNLEPHEYFDEDGHHMDRPVQRKRKVPRGYSKSLSPQQIAEVKRKLSERLKK